MPPAPVHDGSAADEHVPATERLFRAFAAASDWAASDLRTQPDGSPGKGCANPLGCLKALFFLVGIALLPLFVLPFIVARTARGGLAMLRNSAAMDVVSGDAARRGHGLLPLPGQPTASAVIAAIGGRDPGFRSGALTDWAISATGLLRQSLISGDPVPARTVMANGLYHAHQALLEQRTAAEISCTGEWQAVSADVAEAYRSPLLEQVRVRVTCQGQHWERHEPTGLTLRGGPGEATWLEDLTFGRAAEAVTPPGGGLPASRCPTCGASLDLDLDGACRYCKGIVTAGLHDWVLVGWQRAPW
jgi:hypothetical protein